MAYQEDDYLLLSGLQHFAFCRRQWALIHIENQWAENYNTVDGQLLHKKAHDSSFSESRGNIIIKRGVSVYSSTFGISGKCDVLEFHRSDDGISLAGHKGHWQPFPVEYKRGRPINTEADALQLCGQALCLEEMLICSIPNGALFYGEARHREPVEFTLELRNRTKALISEMHNIYSKGYTPIIKPHKGCKACSLKELCLPKMLKAMPVSRYLEEALNSL